VLLSSLLGGSFQGIQGPAGTPGNFQGTQGVQGLQGTQSTQGLQGLAGQFAGQGLQGTQGTQGIQGISGLYVGQGAQGTQSTQGLQGNLGIQGLSGSFAGQGVQGISGGGGGSSLTISESNSNTPQYIGFVTNTSATSIGITQTNLTFIPSSGRLGIGVTSPQFSADVGGDIRVQSNNKMRFGGTSSSTNFYIQYNSTTNSLDFVAG
jgi:hypothetical protein